MEKMRSWLSQYSETLRTQVQIPQKMLGRSCVPETPVLGGGRRTLKDFASQSGQVGELHVQ